MGWSAVGHGPASQLALGVIYSSCLTLKLLSSIDDSEANTANDAFGSGLEQGLSCGG